MSISTLSFNTQTRTSILRVQGELNDLTLQLNNGGRYNDVGRQLGRLTGSSISARALGESLKEQQTSNGIIDRRLTNIDAAMKNMSDGAQKLANNLIGVSVGKDYANIVQQAQAGLAQMNSSLNTSDSGSYIFGGINSDNAPIKTDAASAASAKAQVAAHFNAFVNAATSGMAGGPAVSLVTADQMTQYLTTGFTDPAVVTPPAVAQVYKYSDLFGPTPSPVPATAPAGTFSNWSDNVSNASSVNSSSRISGTETVTSTASANDPAFRTMASAYTMLSDLNIAGLGETARTVVLNTAATTLKSASTSITTMQAAVGTTRARIDTANDELVRQQDIMTKTVDGLEEGDVTDLGVRVNALETQLQTAYAVTGKIQKLTLLDYL